MSENGDITVHLEAGSSFKGTLLKYVVNETRDECCVMLFLDESTEENCSVYSLKFHTVRQTNLKENKILYRISNVTWQDEGNVYHNVCYSKGSESAVYNYCDDAFESDVYLEDRYGDCADLYLTSAINSLFDSDYKCKTKSD